MTQQDHLGEAMTRKLGALPSEAIRCLTLIGARHVSLVVGDLRAKALRVGSDPMEENAFHGQVWGVKETTRKVVQGLVKGWIVPLAGVALR
jgi:hypothetical protein